MLGFGGRKYQKCLSTFGNKFGAVADHLLLNLKVEQQHSDKILIASSQS